MWNKPKEPQSISADLAYIKFSVDQNLNINFSCDWHNLDPSVATSLGKLLYDLNKGLYSDPVLQHLTARGLNRPEETAFIRSIFNKWSDLATIEETDSKPLVQPSVAFFKNAKYKT
jgi:hypothetical protein